MMKTRLQTPCSTAQKPKPRILGLALVAWDILKEYCFEVQGGTGVIDVLGHQGLGFRDRAFRLQGKGSRTYLCRAPSMHP